MIRAAMHSPSNMCIHMRFYLATGFILGLPGYATSHVESSRTVSSTLHSAFQTPES
jgi:hypothetical protein